MIFLLLTSFFLSSNIPVPHRGYVYVCADRRLHVFFAYELYRGQMSSFAVSVCNPCIYICLLYAC
jgi:hypothetical protein